MGSSTRRNFLLFFLLASLVSLFNTTSLAQQPKVLAPHRRLPQLVPQSAQPPLPPGKTGRDGRWLSIRVFTF